MRSSKLPLVVVAVLGLAAGAVIAGPPDEVDSTRLPAPGAVPATTMDTSGPTSSAPATTAPAPTSGPTAPAATTTTLLQSAGPVPTAAPDTRLAVTIEVIGDSYTSGTDIGGGAVNWTTEMQTRFDLAKYRVDVFTAASVGSGYAAMGERGLTFARMAETSISADADVVIVFGSRNDGPHPRDAVVAGANATYSAIRARAPQARILVIGPAWVNENIPGSILSTRDGLREVALAAGATWVDPIAEDWFFGADAALIGADGVHPTDDGHRYMAERITPHVVALLPPA